MKRREFLTKSIVWGAAGITLPVPRLYGAPTEAYAGRILVTVQADGGWDVTSFCDPKVNQAGEQEITHWSNDREILTAGNINYAPFADNTAFFEKYYQDMLVINGVDMQTNSHTTGVLHSWSGRNAEGFPSITALFAANQAPNQPLSYLNFGGFSQTANLIRFSRIDDVGTLNNLLQPEIKSDEVNVRNPSDMNRIREYRSMRLARMMSDPNLLNRQSINLDAYNSAQESKSALAGFSDFLPSADQVYEDVQVNSQVSSNLRRQIQMSVAAFKAGLASAADLFIGGYDTHTNHDALHSPLLAHTTDSIDLLWTSAEEAGIADRMTVVIGSDFGRTPNYNADNGKDHWPIGSVVVMEKNAGWTNRTIGLTDGAHNAYSINPASLQRDDNNGTIIYPKHVHKALRRHLALENTPVEQNLAFTNTEDFGFFG